MVQIINLSLYLKTETAQKNFFHVENFKSKNKSSLHNLYLEVKKLRNSDYFYSTQSKDVEKACKNRSATE